MSNGYKFVDNVKLMTFMVDVVHIDIIMRVHWICRPLENDLKKVVDKFAKNHRVIETFPLC